VPLPPFDLENFRYHGPDRERCSALFTELGFRTMTTEFAPAAVAVARETSATVVASPELAAWLERQGVKHLRPMNIGGRQHLSGLQIAMVPAVHSSSAPDGAYLGPATGFVVRFEDDMAVYFAGDTALFGDMRLIRDRHAPQVAFLPIGDRFTMGPDDAALAAEWLGVKAVVPIHYETFPELTGTPDELRRHCRPKGIEVIELRAGEIAR
jgi:L-ascorbate metabolism protein UlaG (beta-lactamase superfamily)